MMPCQDYREGQSQKTLAYAQALQYWAKKANLPGPDERHLLAMRPFTTFSYHAVLEGVMPNLGSQEVEAVQPNTTPKEQTPMRPPTPPAAALPNKLAALAVGHEHLGWMGAHLSHPAASVGHIPMSLGDLRWCCQSQSSS